MAHSPVKTTIEYDTQTFTGFHMDADRSRPSVRREPLSIRATRLERRIATRESEQKVLQDMFRRTLKKIEETVQNKGKLVCNNRTPCVAHHSSRWLVILNFRLADSVEKRVSGKVTLRTGEAFGVLADHEFRLTVSGGPRLLVDLDGIWVFFYCPGFMGKGPQVRRSLSSISSCFIALKQTELVEKYFTAARRASRSLSSSERGTYMGRR
jgi:hypothetical protein